MNSINKNMFLLARESRGMTQTDLADKIGMSRPIIGKFENGDIGVKEEILTQIASATNYPVSFFYQEGELIPEHLIYRKKEKVAQSLLSPIGAKINIIRLNVQALQGALDVCPPVLPTFEVSNIQTPQVIAKKLRILWHLSLPVVCHLIDILESKGIAIASFDFKTERVDSRCALTDKKSPIIIFNSTQLGDRQRFSIAYQLGHLIMHTATNVPWERDVNHEANLFAAEFLMPEEHIRKDFENGVTLPLLGALKLKWKVSMISLLYRADDLGLLSPNQKRYLLQQFNEQKVRRREPVELDVPPEYAILINDWIDNVKKQNSWDTKDVAAFLNLSTEDYLDLYKN